MVLQFLCSSTLLVLIVSPLLQLVSAGHEGVVDDEIWHHVSKVLSDHEGGKKVLLSHPEPAHLVDAYTKVYHHEPHFDNYHHQVYDGHHDHHHDDHHHHHHRFTINPHHYHHHAPAVFKIPAPVPVGLPAPVFSTIRFGPPPPLPLFDPYHHFRK